MSSSRPASFSTGCAPPTLHPAPLSDHVIPMLSLVHWYSQHPSRTVPPPLHETKHVSIISQSTCSPGPLPSKSTMSPRPSLCSTSSAPPRAPHLHHRPVPPPPSLLHHQGAARAYRPRRRVHAPPRAGVPPLTHAQCKAHPPAIPPPVAPATAAARHLPRGWAWFLTHHVLAARLLLLTDRHRAHARSQVLPAPFRTDSRVHRARRICTPHPNRRDIRPALRPRHGCVGVPRRDVHRSRTGCARLARVDDARRVRTGSWRTITLATPT
jgi:hypothetical protein